MAGWPVGGEKNQHTGIEEIRVRKCKEAGVGDELVKRNVRDCVGGTDAKGCYTLFSSSNRATFSSRAFT